MSHRPDEEILELIAGKDTLNYGFNLLVKKYQQRVYWHIRRMVIHHDDADDVTQATFIKVWKKLHQFRGDSQLFSWIYRIATNETLTFLAQKKKIMFLPIADVRKELENNLQNSIGDQAEEIQIKLQKAILKLPTKQRMIFNMRYFDELPFNEISEILGTSVGALKASYHIAAKKIRENLTE